MDEHQKCNKPKKTKGRKTKKIIYESDDDADDIMVIQTRKDFLDSDESGPDLDEELDQLSCISGTEDELDCNEKEQEEEEPDVVVYDDFGDDETTCDPVIEKIGISGKELLSPELIEYLGFLCRFRDNNLRGIDTLRCYELAQRFNHNPVTFMKLDGLDYDQLVERTGTELIGINPRTLIDHAYRENIGLIPSLILGHSNFRTEWVRLFRKHPRTKVIEMGLANPELKQDRFCTQCAKSLNIYEFITMILVTKDRIKTLFTFIQNHIKDFDFTKIVNKKYSNDGVEKTILNSMKIAEHVAKFDAEKIKDFDLDIISLTYGKRVTTDQLLSKLVKCKEGKKGKKSEHYDSEEDSDMDAGCDNNKVLVARQLVAKCRGRPEIDCAYCLNRGNKVYMQCGHATCISCYTETQLTNGRNIRCIHCNKTVRSVIIPFE